MTINGVGKITHGQNVSIWPLPLILQQKKDLNITLKTLKLLEGNVGKILKTLEQAMISF